MFNLKDFDHLRDDNTVQFKEEIVDGVEVITICYMISNDKLWDMPLGRECRGHAFNTNTGELISMAYNKFWNINEKEETQKHSINWDEPFEVQEKRDGSMITFASINDEVYAKTKKSFYSDVAILANKLAPYHVKSVSKILLESGLSPIWEFTHPEWKIVVDYGEEPTWTLLAIRDMSSGVYLSNKNIYGMIKSVKYSLGITDNLDFFVIQLNPHIETYDEIDASIRNMTDAEGYVIYFPSTGLRVKTKSNWYNLRHHINTDLRERDVAKYTVEETLDDVKSTSVELGYDMSKVTNIEARVVCDMIYIKTRVEHLANQLKEYPTRKDAAIALSKEKFFGEAIKLNDGREVDYKKIWYRDFLQDYSLKTVYSDFNHTKELDVVE